MKIEDSELKRLAIAVRQEIESYVYEVPEHSLSSAWSGEKIYAAIAKMRACLVEPYWIKVDVSDTSKQVSGYVLKKATYAVIADDGDLKRESRASSFAIMHLCGIHHPVCDAAPAISRRYIDGDDMCRLLLSARVPLRKKKAGHVAGFFCNDREGR